MDSGLIFTQVMSWSRNPASEIYTPVQTCSPAQASEVLEQIVSASPKGATGADKYAYAYRLTAEPEHIRAGIARYIPRKDFAVVARWLGGAYSPTVYAEILMRQNQGDGHLRVTKKVLAFLAENPAQCREVAHIMGTPEPWLTSLAASAYTPGGGMIPAGAGALLLLAASQPLTAEDHLDNVVRWACEQCKQKELDGSADALEAFATASFGCCGSFYWYQHLMYALIEISRCHEKPHPRTTPAIVLREYTSDLMLTSPPQTMYPRHRAVRKKLDVALQRDMTNWRSLVQAQEALLDVGGNLADVLVDAGFPVEIHPDTCNGCLNGSH